MLTDGDIIYVDTGTTSSINPRIYEIDNIFYENGRAWCRCHVYYENRQDEKNQHMKLSTIEKYIERLSYDKDLTCMLLDETELAKFLLER